MENEREVLVEVNHLNVTYGSGKKAYEAVQDANFKIYKGETFGLVGESGSGKSTILRAILGLMGQEGRILDGSITFDEVELPSLKPEQMRKYRGAVIATVHQQAGLSMDPITKIGKQFHEAIRTKEKHGRNPITVQLPA